MFVARLESRRDPSVTRPGGYEPGAMESRSGRQSGGSASNSGEKGGEEGSALGHGVGEEVLVCGVSAVTYCAEAVEGGNAEGASEVTVGAAAGHGFAE